MTCLQRRIGRISGGSLFRFAKLVLAPKRPKLQDFYFVIRIWRHWRFQVIQGRHRCDMACYPIYVCCILVFPVDIRSSNEIIWDSMLGSTKLRLIVGTPVFLSEMTSFIITTLTLCLSNSEVVKFPYLRNHPLTNLAYNSANVFTNIFSRPKGGITFFVQGDRSHI